ncbi:C-type lectin-like domain-containing protein [Aquimarina algiphila]|uniref:hypothetical protein n=1 Tax=Aquimarina algiphila TaxID=2047982 RepID=UPI00232DBEC1|nr:hypothetical protein [Aquimarina algiphila]
MRSYLIIIVLFSTIFLLEAQETYIDNFGTVSYANNDGTANWAGNWAEIEPFATDDDPFGGFIRITGNRLRFRFIFAGDEQIQRTADLTGAATATLSFDWETFSLEAGETIDVQISSTGGAPFTTLASFGNGVNTTDTFTQDISGFISANTTIRFINTNNDWNQGNDRFFVDNLQIETFVNMAPVITVSGDQHFCPNATNSIPVVQTVSITDVDDTELDQVTIQVSTGYQNGQDVLTLTGVHPNITDSWDVVEGRLTLTGPTTLAEFEAAVLAVEFSSTPPVVTGLREFSVVLGSPLFLPETGHYYEFVPSLGIRWDDARDEAALRTFFGLQGYLTTLTSVIEATFAGSQITGTGWIGASDNFGTGEGEWRWETGPEAGTVFWNGNQTGAVAPGEFAFWNNNEPNDCCSGTNGEENYAHITDNTIGIENSWNDLPITGGGGAYQAQGYIVEYGGLPGDPVLQISGVTRLRISCSVITNRSKTYRVNN